MVDSITAFMTSHGPAIIYSAILICGLAEYVFPPFPSDTLLLVAGVMAGEGILDPFAAFALTMLGSLGGAICLYELGRTRGRQFFFEKNYPFFPKERIAKLEEWMARHGAKILILNRFFSGFRAVFFVAAGIGRMRFIHVALYGMIGSAIWTGLIIVTGYLVGQRWMVVRKYLQLYSSVIVVLVTIVFLAVLIRYIATKRKRQARAPSE